MAKFMRIENVTPQVWATAKQWLEKLADPPEEMQTFDRPFGRFKKVLLRYEKWEIEYFSRDLNTDILHVTFVARIKTAAFINRDDLSKRLTESLGVIGYPLIPAQAAFAGVIKPERVTWADLSEAYGIIEKMSTMISPTSSMS